MSTFLAIAGGELKAASFDTLFGCALLKCQHWIASQLLIRSLKLGNLGSEVKCYQLHFPFDKERYWLCRITAATCKWCMKLEILCPLHRENTDNTVVTAVLLYLQWYSDMSFDKNQANKPTKSQNGSIK